MDILFIGGMLGGAFIEGSQQSGKIDAIKNQIAELQQTNTSLKASYASLITQTSADITQMKDTVIGLQQKKAATVSELTAARNEYDRTQARLRYYGIAFTAYVFFSLFMKLILPKGGIFGLISGKATTS